MTDWTSEEGITEEEKIYYYRKAGEIGYNVLTSVQKMIKPGVPIIEICETAEKMILEEGADGFGFPTNVSINNIAAHYSSPYGDENVIPDKGSIKLDIGIHCNGYIADTAVTVILSPELKNLKLAAEEGFKAGMEIIQAGTLPSLVGKRIEETITSYDYRPIRELTGHKLGRYELHGDKLLPNISVPYDPAEGALEAGEAYALETFASSGTGSVHEVTGIKYIYMLLPKRIPLRNPVSRKIYSTTYKKYKTLPFAERWLSAYDEFNRARVRFTLRELQNGGGVVPYPALADEKGSYVAQYEHTFIITENEGVIVTTQPPFDFEVPESLQEKPDDNTKEK
ncbi:MAG: type II methionyl aminopeptidase [Candidatus Heimdallarchaeota archaeon]|nr:MAG: type II methionyl aminopeptidase [Candidatus Heimdallarchaeota archaeon]